MKKCRKCNEIKELSCYYANKASKDGFSTRCKECIKNYAKEYRKDYYLKNKQTVIEYSNRYNKTTEKGKKSSSKSRKKYIKARYKSDKLFKIGSLMRTRVCEIVKQKSIQKNSKTARYLGCSLPEFISYMESKFESGMSWDNHSIGGWHIDHIIPISSAKTEEDLFKLCHYTNLQPLWCIDNLKKADSF